MQKISANFEKAWKAIIQPPKFIHNINNLCQKRYENEVGILERIDFQAINERKQKLSCIILKPSKSQFTETILYLHGNGGCKMQIQGFINLICLYKIAVIAFDFIGCGNSDKGYLTYGFQQSYDANLVLKQAMKYIKINKLTLWGRSMGALTAIMFTKKYYHLVTSLVLDTPFANLFKVVNGILKKITCLPSPFISILLYFIQVQIANKIQYPIFQQNYLSNFRKIPQNLPVLLMYSQNDDIVTKQMVFDFYIRNRVNHCLMQINQKHYQDRNSKVFQEGIQWIQEKNRNRRNGKLKLLHLSDFAYFLQQNQSTMC